MANTIYLAIQTHFKHS